MISMIEHYPNIFSISLHHGGHFINFPGRRYENESHTFVDLLDIEKFSVHEIDSIMEDLGYDGNGKVMYYYFLVPNHDLDFGLRTLGDDNDIINLRQYVAKHKMIEV